MHLPYMFVDIGMHLSNIKVIHEGYPTKKWLHSTYPRYPEQVHKTKNKTNQYLSSDTNMQR